MRNTQSVSFAIEGLECWPPFQESADPSSSISIAAVCWSPREKSKLEAIC
jgi:hypothetical protein